MDTETKTVKSVRIEVAGFVNSFRVPTSHTHQATLPHPPRTTLLGLVGAALGLSPEQCLGKDFSDKFSFCIVETTPLDSLQSTCPCQWQGTLSDLWNYRKYKAGVFETSSILIRDCLYLHSWMVYIIPASLEPTIEAISMAIDDPAWCLSLGREDELVRIESVEVVNLELINVVAIGRTIIPADLKEPGMLKVDLKSVVNSQRDLRRLTTLKPPRVVRLPRYYEFDENGNRTGVDYRIYSFIESPVGFVLGKTMLGYRDPDEGHSMVPI